MRDVRIDYSDDQLKLDLRWWAAANYLTVAQSYLRENPLLRDRPRAQHIKRRLLGHWGASPALSLIYPALNRLTRATGQDCLYITGLGHGGPGPRCQCLSRRGITDLLASGKRSPSGGAEQRRRAVVGGLELLGEGR